MFTGQQLGAAIEQAIKLKGVSKKQVADDFGIKPPSVQDWIKKGTVGKDKIEDLVAYFSDVCPPEHFGINSQGIFGTTTSSVAFHYQGFINPEEYDLGFYQDRVTGEKKIRLPRQIPVISKIPAGSAKTIVDSFAVGGGDDYITPRRHCRQKRIRTRYSRRFNGSEIFYRR